MTKTKPRLICNRGWWSISNWGECLSTTPNSKERWNVHLALEWVKTINKRRAK